MTGNSRHRYFGTFHRQRFPRHHVQGLDQLLRAKRLRQKHHLIERAQRGGVLILGFAGYQHEARRMLLDFGPDLPRQIDPCHVGQMQGGHDRIGRLGANQFERLGPLVRVAATTMSLGLEILADDPGLNPGRFDDQNRHASLRGGGLATSVFSFGRPTAIDELVDETTARTGASAGPTPVPGLTVAATASSAATTSAIDWKPIGGGLRHHPVENRIQFRAARPAERLRAMGSPPRGASAGSTSPTARQTAAGRPARNRACIPGCRCRPGDRWSTNRWLARAACSPPSRGCRRPASGCSWPRHPAVLSRAKPEVGDLDHAGLIRGASCAA